MANAQKRKGDQAERDYLAHFTTVYPHLARPDAMRHLGAGRRDDVGDVRVMYGVACQVKHWSNVSAAIFDAVRGVRRQRFNGGDLLGVGIVKVPRARPPRPVWIACALEDEWPAPVSDSAPLFRQSGRLLTWLATTEDPPAVARARSAARTVAQRRALPPAPAPREERAAVLQVGQARYVVGTEEAWLRVAVPTLAAHRIDPARGAAPFSGSMRA